MHILFFQHGDYGEAYRRLEAGGPETYRDQRASVEFAAGLLHAHKVTTVAICNRSHDEDLAHGLRSIGINDTMAADSVALGTLLSGLAPDALILRTPSLQVLRWAEHHDIPTLPMFADMFPRPRQPWSFLKAMRFRRTLLVPCVPCVANHSLNASLSLATGLWCPEDRIVPWDRQLLAIEPSPKPAPGNAFRLSAFSAGALLESKGVGDCLDAVALLKARGVHMNFTFAGPGDVDRWRRKAEDLGIADRILLPGRIPNATVRARMREADFVIVPSRHDYAEGLPNTLCEGLASRTPVVISDHPAFVARLKHGRDCAIFRAGNPLSLAETLQALGRDRDLYARISEASAATYRTFFFGTPWTKLLQMFIDDPRDLTGWVAAHSLARLRRDGALALAQPQALS